MGDPEVNEPDQEPDDDTEVTEHPWVTVKGGGLDGLRIRLTAKGEEELDRLEARGDAADRMGRA